MPVRDKLKELSDEELGTLYVQLKSGQLTVATAETAKALDAVLRLVIREMENRDPRSQEVFPGPQEPPGDKERCLKVPSD